MAEVASNPVEQLISDVEKVDLSEQESSADGSNGSEVAESATTAPTTESSSSASDTVFKSNSDFSVVHPLTYSWSLWYTKPETGKEKDWSELLKEVVKVSTVEEFWGVYNNVPKIAELPIKGDYSLFRHGIRPEWEDPKNGKGGKWLYQFASGRARNVSTDDTWLRLILALIGGTLDNESADKEEINGVVINVRRSAIKFNVWTKTTNPATVEPVGKRFKDVLGLGVNDQVEFSPHAEGNKVRASEKLFA